MAAMPDITRIQRAPRMGTPLTWSLVVVTYNRGPALRRSLPLAARQTRPPQEIIVVDASADWNTIRDHILEETAVHHPAIRWEFMEARAKSITAQRNQGIDRVRSDVVFLFDDDSYMYPDCAAEIMAVYDADLRGQVAGANAMLADSPPDVPRADAAAGPAAAPALPRLSERLRSLFERQLHAELLLLPYDRRYPDHPIPEELRGLEVAATRYLHGMRMTFRRELIQQERFDEMLRRYAAAEDLDASYRVSRHGALLNVFRARLFHAQDGSMRLTRYAVTVLALMNLAMMYRLKGYSPGGLLRSFQARVLRRLGIDFLRDLANRRFSLPCARADCRALALMAGLREQSEAHLRRWYPAFLEDMNNRNPW
jgi:GT2 family glycosyltransferase